MAMEFAKNHTLPDASDDIDSAVQAVSGTWSGRAASQFNTYAGTVGKALDGQQDVIGGMSGILSGIAGCMIETYSRALEFIGTCAVELGKFGYKTIVAIVTSAIPIVDIFTSKDVIDAVVDAFANLVTAVNGLFAQAFSTLGDFRTQATALVQGDTDFPDIPRCPPTPEWTTKSNGASTRRRLRHEDRSPGVCRSGVGKLVHRVRPVDTRARAGPAAVAGADRRAATGGPGRPAP
jgi:hypothetical protein